MSDRLYRLVEVHQRIDEELQHEQRRRSRDPFRVMRLKKPKLRAKDLIRRCILAPSSAQAGGGASWQVGCADCAPDGKPGRRAIRPRQ